MKKPVLAVCAFVYAVVLAASPSHGATSIRYYRGYAETATGPPVGIGLIAEEQIGKSLAYRFTIEDDRVRTIERLGRGRALSTRLIYSDGRLVHTESYDSKGELASVKSRTYNADGLVTTETYEPKGKGKERQSHTTKYSYDEDGRLIEIRREQPNGSAHTETYDRGLLVERSAIDRHGRVSTEWEYVYGPRFKRIWEKERILNRVGEPVRESVNPLLRDLEPPDRPEIQPVKTTDDEAELTRVSITHPAFSPTNSRHVKDTTRLRAMLNRGRPLRLELRSPATGDVVRTLSRARVSSVSAVHFKWDGVLGTGEMAPDGAYPYCIRTPVVHVWQVEFAERTGRSGRMLDCTDKFAYVCDAESARVIVFNPDGEIERIVELATDRTWGRRTGRWPSTLHVVDDERFYMTYGDRFRVHDLDGALLNEIAPQLNGLPYPSSFAVDEQGRVVCVVEHTHSHGKEECGFTVLELDEEGCAVRVLAEMTGFSSERDRPPFVHQGVLYVNAVHFPGGTIQRALLSVDMATGARRLVEHNFAVTDAGLRTPALLATGHVEFYDMAGALVMAFDCRRPTFALQGSRVYSLTDLDSVLRCYETESDKVLLEGQLVVDNTAPAASITSPGADGLVTGEPDRFEITGIATDVNFEKYEVYWRFATSRNARWRLLKDSDVPCDGGTLAVWDTTTSSHRNVKNRDIELKLVVTDRAGNTTDEPFAICYDADGDGFSNEFELSNRQLDKDARTERRTARIEPDIMLMLTREYPVNGTCPLSVLLVDAETSEVLDRGVLEFAVNVGSVRPRKSIHSRTQRATAQWHTPASVELAGLLTVTLPPQGIHNVWYTAEPFELSLPLMVDSDFDGLTDEYENGTEYGHGETTSATNPDSDGDGIDDLHDLSPTQAPAVSFAEEYPAGALRFKQTYHIISIAGDDSKVTKNGIDVGRWPLMDKAINPDSVKDWFNDTVFITTVGDETTEGPLHVIEAVEIEELEGEQACKLNYVPPAKFPKYVFEYYTKEYLYELHVANREPVKYPLNAPSKYGFIEQDVSLCTHGGNTLVVQFRLGATNRWEDEDEEGNFTKLFMRYSLYARGTVADAFPYYTGMAAMEWTGADHFEAHIVLPDEVFAAMSEHDVGGEQTVVLSPVWVEHRGGPLPCIHENHPPIPVERESCLLCGYRPERDTFTAAYTRNATLTALEMHHEQYAMSVFGRLTARAGGPPAETATDYDTLTSIAQHFNPHGGAAGEPANGLVPVTVDGHVCQVLYIEYVPGGEGTSADPAALLESQLPGADALVVRAASSWHLNRFIGVFKATLAVHDWGGQWAALDPAETPSLGTGSATGPGDDQAAEQGADDALDKLQTVGTRFSEVREVAEFVVDLSNMPASFKADQLSSQLANPTTFSSMMLAGSQSEYNVGVTKLPSGQLEVALQRRRLFHSSRTASGKICKRYRVKTVRTEQVDDLTDSKIATQYGVVNKIPAQLIVGAKIGATLMTDGVDFYKALRDGDGVHIVYYGVRGTSNVLVVLGSASVKWQDKAVFRSIQLTKTAKFNVAAAVVAVVDVSYNIFRTATADTWLGRMAYAERTAAAVIDGVIGCVEPYGAAATIGWQVGVFAGEKICDKLGWGESSTLAQSATSSIGSAVVFLFQEASLLGVPTATANDAGTYVQNKIMEEVEEFNAYLNERNMDEPREVFIPPDKDD